MNRGCTLVLTQGTHIITESSALEVECAMDSGARAVDITLDMTGSGNTFSQARLSMAHVIAVIRHPVLETAPRDQSNVYALRSR